MKAHSGTSNSKIVSTEKELQLSRRMAKDVLAECASDRMCNGVNLWVFALLAKIISSAKSVEILARCRQVGDCFVILRTMSDAAVAIEYILHDPSRTTQLLELFGIEIAVERYEELKFGAEWAELPLEEAAKRISHGSKTLKDYAKAKLHPAYHAKRDEWPRRWRNISVDAMYKAISGTKRGGMAKHIASSIPNSFAHSGPIAIQHFSCFDKHDRPRFRCGTFEHEWYRPRLVRRIASAIVLTSCKDIVENFHLNSSLQRRLFKLGRRVVPTQFKDGD